MNPLDIVPMAYNSATSIMALFEDNDRRQRLSVIAYQNDLSSSGVLQDGAYMIGDSNEPDKVGVEASNFIYGITH